MATLRASKVLSSLPGTLQPDTMYCVRVGTGFDFYVTDSTGAIAYKMNAPVLPGAGPMNSAAATGTAVALGTAEAQVGSVTINVGNATSKVLLIARASLTKDSGTTVRTATMRVRAGTQNTDAQVGGDSVISSSGVASSAYYGNAVVLGEHVPGATGNITYSLRGLVGAGASTVSSYTLEAVELTGAQGPKGDAPWVQLTQAAYDALGTKDPATLYLIVG